MAQGKAENTRLTTKEHWQKGWKRLAKKESNKDIFRLMPLLKRHLPLPGKRKTGRKNKETLLRTVSCIEIGCAPGRYMALIKKSLGYDVAGIDICCIDQTRSFLVSQGIKSFKLYEKDFFSFKATEQYNVVCSFGFIEHFSDPEAVFDKMLELLREKGFLVIGIPNFRYAQFLLHKLIDDRNALDGHNLSIMSTKKLSEIAKKKGLDIVFNSYYIPFMYWHSNNSFFQWLFGLPFVALTKAISYAIAFFRLLFGEEFGLKLDVLFASRYFSPYIVFIARKKEKRL